MIRPTALGWKGLAFFATLWTAYFAAPYQNLFFLLLAFLTSLALLNVIWTLRNVAGVTGEIAAVPAFACGASAGTSVVLHAGRRRRFALAVTLDLGARGSSTTRCDVTGGTGNSVGEIVPQPRGIHEVRGAFVESTYPLGLLRVRRRIRAPQEIVVHPAPADLPRASGAAEAGLAAVLSGARGADQPSGLREFRQGDAVRSIHWRATARRGRPVVTEWDASVGDGLEVVLDRRTDANSLEVSLSLVTTLALAARETKERFTLHTQGLSRAFGEGHAPWEELLRALAAADRLDEGAPAPPPAATAVLRLPLRREVVPA